jgi:hypothetical protein
MLFKVIEPVIYFPVQAAIDLKTKVVAEVMAGNMTVVCDGVTSDILPGLDDSKVPGFHVEPYGPHPVGNFKVKTGGQDSIGVLVSISPTFYEQLLRQNPFAKKLQTKILST